MYHRKAYIKSNLLHKYCFHISVELNIKPRLFMQIIIVQRIQFRGFLLRSARIYFKFSHPA